MSQHAQEAAETLTAEGLAARCGVSAWSIYESVKRGDCPVPAIKIGRRIVFAKAAVDRLLGVQDVAS